MPEPIEHAESRGFIESVLHYIPGFRGYLRKENRREADELQRNWLADQLQRGKRGLDDYARARVEAGQLDDMTTVDRLRHRLDKVIARIRGAMQGYSGFFDLVTIDEKELNRIYNYDVSLMEQVARLADALEATRDQADQPAGEVIAPLLDQAEAINDAWDKREDMLSGIE